MVEIREKKFFKNKKCINKMNFAFFNTTPIYKKLDTNIKLFILTSQQKILGEPVSYATKYNGLLILTLARVNLGDLRSNINQVLRVNINNT